MVFFHCKDVHFPNEISVFLAWWLMSKFSCSKISQICSGSKGKLYNQDFMKFQDGWSSLGFSFNVIYACYGVSTNVACRLVIRTCGATRIRTFTTTILTVLLPMLESRRISCVWKVSVVRKKKRANRNTSNPTFAIVYRYYFYHSI